jgi:hypothetical protein
LIKTVPLETSVIIVTESQSDYPKSEADFRNSWRHVSDAVPPQVEIYVYGINRDSPMHDRLILCDKKGLFIGTSPSGYGTGDTIIQILDEQDKAKVEAKIVDKLLYYPPSHHKGKRLQRRVFTL